MIYLVTMRKKNGEMGGMTYGAPGKRETVIRLALKSFEKEYRTPGVVVEVIEQLETKEN